MQQEQAMQTMRTLATEFYDPHILDVYFDLLSSGKVFENHDIDVCLGVSCLKTGMHLTQDLLNKQGAVILTAGTEITPSIIEKLKKYQKDWNYIFNVFVHQFLFLVTLWWLSKNLQFKISLVLSYFLFGARYFKRI